MIRFVLAIAIGIMWAAVMLLAMRALDAVFAEGRGFTLRQRWYTLRRNFRGDRCPTCGDGPRSLFFRTKISLMCDECDRARTAARRKEFDAQLEKAMREMPQSIFWPARTGSLN